MSLYGLMNRILVVFFAYAASAMAVTASLEKIMINEDTCVKRIDEEKIYLKEEMIYLTNTGVL